MIRSLSLATIAAFAVLIGFSNEAHALPPDQILFDPAANTNFTAAGPATVNGTYYAQGDDRMIIAFVYAYDPVTQTKGAQVGPMRQQGPVAKGYHTWSMDLGALPAGTYAVDVALVKPSGLSVVVLDTASTTITVAP